MVRPLRYKRNRAGGELLKEAASPAVLMSALTRVLITHSFVFFLRFSAGLSSSLLFLPVQIYPRFLRVPQAEDEPMQLGRENHVR